MNASLPGPHKLTALGADNITLLRAPLSLIPDMVLGSRLKMLSKGEGLLCGRYQANQIISSIIMSFPQQSGPFGRLSLLEHFLTSQIYSFPF